MSLKAQDLLPLVSQLSHEEQVQLARLVLAAAAGSASTDPDAYRKKPEGRGEFSSDEEHLAWEAEGWEEFGGAG